MTLDVDADCVRRKRHVSSRLARSHDDFGPTHRFTAVGFSGTIRHICPADLLLRSTISNEHTHGRVAFEGKGVCDRCQGDLRSIAAASDVLESVGDSTGDSVVDSRVLRGPR